MASVVLDFGMHDGEDTEFYLATGAHVVAFEANPRLVKSNQVRFGEAIAQGRLRIVEGAIAPPSFVGQAVTFYENVGKTVWGTIKSEWAERNISLGTSLAEISVNVVDLKSILSEVSDLLYAKIDIEGADLHVLEAIADLKLRPHFISIESDKTSLNGVIREIELLQSLGYTGFAAVQQAAIKGQHIGGQRLDGGRFTHRFRHHASGPFGPYLRQPFKSASEVIDDYRAIFRRYALFGDDSAVMQFSGVRLLTRGANAILLKTFGVPLCGWYDTHATF